jgi:hypothetical protein
VAGIAPLEGAPGYARVLVAPTLVPGLEHAAATYESAAGPIASGWRRVEAGVECDISIPANVMAEIRLGLPDGATAADVTEGGRSLDEAPGVEVLGVAEEVNGRVIRMRTGSGRYRFAVTPASE